MDILGAHCLRASTTYGSSGRARPQPKRTWRRSRYANGLVGRPAATPMSDGPVLFRKAHALNPHERGADDGRRPRQHPQTIELEPEDIGRFVEILGSVSPRREVCS